MVFKDRSEAGSLLAVKLTHYRNQNPILLALPRGGVPIGFEIARKLFAPLHILVVRKLGAPLRREFGIGAIAEGGILIKDEKVIAQLGIDSEEFLQILEKEKKELARRVIKYRKQKMPELADKTVIIVDDGLATGVSAKAAILSVLKNHPKKIIFASPVCARDPKKELEKIADEVICYEEPENFSAVGQWYHNFQEVTDEQVLSLLNESKDKYQ